MNAVVTAQGLVKAYKNKRALDGASFQIPAGRMGAPEEIAAAVAFFASPGSDFVTGQTLSVSGGLTMC